MSLKLTDLQKIVLQAVKEVRKKENLQEAGELAIKAMKIRTRTGRGVNEPEGKTVALKKLEPTTKKVRRHLKKKGKLTGENAQPAKSGVNRSGKTLDSLHAEAKEGFLQIKLDAAGELVQKFLQQIDKARFTFMNLSKGEARIITEYLENKVESINKKLK